MVLTCALSSIALDYATYYRIKYRESKKAVRVSNPLSVAVLLIGLAPPHLDDERLAAATLDRGHVVHLLGAEDDRIATPEVVRGHRTVRIGRRKPATYLGRRREQRQTSSLRTCEPLWTTSYFMQRQWSMIEMHACGCSRT